LFVSPDAFFINTLQQLLVNFVANRSFTRYTDRFIRYGQAADIFEIDILSSISVHSMTNCILTAAYRIIALHYTQFKDDSELSEMSQYMSKLKSFMEELKKTKTPTLTDDDDDEHNGDDNDD